MGANIGPKIGIDGEAEYRKQLQNIIQQAKTLDSEMKAVSSSFDKSTSAQEKSTKTAAVLEKQIANQKEKIEMLSKAVAASAEHYGENATETLKWKEALNNAQTELNRMNSGLDDVDDNLKDGATDASRFGDVLKANLLSDAIINGVKALGNALKEVSKAMITFGKDVVTNFAELEQNLGGSEAVFNQYAETVQRTAEKAYATMGTSESEYLATANKMGALFQGSGLSVERSMELTTQAMQRAADMASVMGIETEAALEAVSGAAKGNYTMMDNLGVAMNATTLESYALSKGMSQAWKEMDNATKAEVAMQYFFERTTQYAGNFERESRETISGSIGMLKASVQSWVAGLGNSEADIVGLTMNIVDSFKAVVTNVQPIVAQMISVLPEVARTAMDAISSSLPEMLTSAQTMIGDAISNIFQSLPEILSTASSVIVGLGKTIISNFSTGLTQNLPELLTRAKEMITSITDGIRANLPQLIKSGLDSLLQFSQGFHDGVSELVENGLEMIKALVEGIIKALPDLIKTVPQIIINFADTINDNMPKILATGVQLLGELIAGIIKAIPTLIANLPKVIEAIVKTIEAFDWLNLGGKIITGIGNGIKNMANALKQFVTNGFSGAIDFLKNLPQQALQWGKDLIQGFINGIKNKIDSLVGTVKGIASKIKSLLGFSEPEEGPLSNFHTFAPDMMKLFAKGILDNQSVVTNAVERAFNFQPMMIPSTETARASQAISYGGFNIVINGSEGQNVNELADAVMDRIETVIGMRGAALA